MPASKIKLLVMLLFPSSKIILTLFVADRSYFNCRQSYYNFLILLFIFVIMRMAVIITVKVIIIIIAFFRGHLCVSVCA